MLKIKLKKILGTVKEGVFLSNHDKERREI